MGKTIGEVDRRFPAGFPPLDPAEDMRIPAAVLSGTVTKIESLESRLTAHKLHGAAEMPGLMALCEQRLALADQITAVRREMKATRSMVQLDELKCRKRVLRRLEFTTADDVVTLKGRVACEISSGDALVLTELIFQGVFTGLTTKQAVALASCFVFDEKSKEEMLFFRTIQNGSTHPKLCTSVRISLSENGFGENQFEALRRGQASIVGS